MRFNCIISNMMQKPDYVIELKAILSNLKEKRSKLNSKINILIKPSRRRHINNNMFTPICFKQFSDMALIPDPPLYGKQHSRNVPRRNKTHCKILSESHVPSQHQINASFSGLESLKPIPLTNKRILESYHIRLASLMSIPEMNGNYSHKNSSNASCYMNQHSYKVYKRSSIALPPLKE